MLKIEYEKYKREKCECCGGTTTRLTRFVYQEECAFAVYYALFTTGHARKVAYVLIGLGEWGEGGSPENRTAFAVKIWDNNGDWAVTAVDKEESPHGDITFLGKVLDRERALQHPWIKDVFHITDHIVIEDEPIMSYFA